MNIDITELESFFQLAKDSPFIPYDGFLYELRAENENIIGHDSPYYALFYWITRKYKPALTVELGTWRGFGSAHFAAGFPEGKVVAVDIHREDKIAQKRVIEIASHYPNMSYINKWTWDAVDDIKALGTPIDILFIDAWHEYQYAMKEWELYSPLLADEALVICDDIFDAAGATVDMVKFWNELSNIKEVVWSTLDTYVHSGVPMGFMYYKR